MALGRSILRETREALGAVLKDELDSIIVERAVIGIFFTGVRLGTGHGGLCFTPVKEIPQAVCCPSSAAAMPLSGRLAGRSAREYLGYLDEPNVLKRALGIAVANALSSLCRERRPPSGYEILMDSDAFDEVDVSHVRKAVVVGALVPMLRKLIDHKTDFRVLEMDPLTLKEREKPFYASPEEASCHVPCADLLVITGTTLINDTLEDLLAMARHDATIVVAGPTASMLPDAFFERGVCLLGGVVVTNADEALDVISEGGSGYHMFGRSAHRVVMRRRAA